MRPKKSAKDIDGTEREGYWWLAFDWHNYRICGNVGNRKKGAFFPLCQGSRVATCNTRHLVEDEIPLLLEPTCEGDPEHLSFNEGGRATPMPGLEGWSKQRAEESIRRYKLNDHEPLREARQKCWRKCREKIAQADAALKATPPTTSSRERLRAAFESLEEMEKRYALLSAGFNLEGVASRVSAILGVKPEEVWAKGKSQRIVEARSLFCYWAVGELRMPMSSLLRRLGISIPSVSDSVTRGQRIAEERNCRLLET